jgi:hypothetical protein
MWPCFKYFLTPSANKPFVQMVIALSAILPFSSADSQNLKLVNQASGASSCTTLQNSLRFPIQLRSGKKLETKVLKPMFEGLAIAIAKSPLNSLCELTPRFECWDQKGIASDKLEFIEISANRVLIRSSCSMSSSNSSSFFVTYELPKIVRKPLPKGKILNASSKVSYGQTPIRGPALVLFPQHPDFIKGPHSFWGLKPMEAVIGFRIFDGATNSMFAYTKGREDGTIGHFQQYVFAKQDGLPRLKLSASKILDDGKEAFQFDALKARIPPPTSAWSTFKPKGELRGCLSSFEAFSCSKTAL